jgi:hypothetical protein
MHNIYVTLSQLHSLDGFIILKDISIEDICIKTHKNIEIPMDSNIDSKFFYDNLLHNK